MHRSLSSRTADGDYRTVCLGSLSLKENLQSCQARGIRAVARARQALVGYRKDQKQLRVGAGIARQEKVANGAEGKRRYSLRKDHD